MENYNLQHQLNDEKRLEQIGQFLFFLQAVGTGAKFQNLLNYQDMKINLDKIRLREFTGQQSYDFENFNEQQIMYCLHSDLSKHVRIVFVTNHSRGGFMFDQQLSHSLDTLNKPNGQEQLESFGYLASYCSNLFLNCRVINVDLMNYHEENLGRFEFTTKTQQQMKQANVILESLDDNYSSFQRQIPNQTQPNEGNTVKADKINAIYFKNPFKIQDQKYDRIIDSVYLTARKIQNLINDIQQWEVDSCLEQDKQLVYFVFESLMTRYYTKHYQNKRNILDFLQKMKFLSEELARIKEESRDFKEKKDKHKEDQSESNKTIDENKKQIENNKKKSQELMKKSTEKLTHLYKERKFKQIELDHMEGKFIEEQETLKKVNEVEYEDFLQTLRNGKGPQLQVAQNVALTFMLMFGTEKIKKKQTIPIEKTAPKLYLQKYQYSKFAEDLNKFSIHREFASENIVKIQQLYEEAIDLNQKYGKVLSRFLRMCLSWFINAINYSKKKAYIEGIQVEFERDIMEAEDQRSRAVNLIAINQQRQEEIKILDMFSKKLQKKILKINSSMGNLKDFQVQLKEIKRELQNYVKKWKQRIVDNAAPFEITHGNMLYIALYFVFIMRFPSMVTSHLKDYIHNILLEWDIRFNIDNAIFKYINVEGMDFQEECALYGIEENQKLFENLALIKLTKKFKLPFPFIYDPLGIAFKYIQQMEGDHGVEIEVITTIDVEDLDEENLKNHENKIFMYYLERQQKNETTFEKLVRCMENGTPIIFKDVDVKTLKLIDSLLQWRYKNHLKELKERYLKKKNEQFFDSDEDSAKSHKTDKDNQTKEKSESSASDDEKNFGRRIQHLGNINKANQKSSQRQSVQGQTHQISRNEENDSAEEDIDTIHFNKAFVTIKKNFRIYLVFSNKDFQNIENYYRQGTTFINMAIEEDEIMMKDVLLDILMQQFQFEPFIITQLLKGHAFKIQKDQIKREKQFFKYFRSGEFNFRNQETINEIKNMLKSLKEVQQQKIKFVLENKYLKRYKALFEKVQKEMEEEEQKEEAHIKDQKSNRPGTRTNIILPQAPSPGESTGRHKKKTKSNFRKQSFGSDHLLQFYLKSPAQQQNKQAFDKLYREILESNYKQKTDFKVKIRFASEPIYLLWKTTIDVRVSIGSLYNYSDNYFKLLVQQTSQELFNQSVSFSNSSTKKEISSITENLILRMMHKLMGGLRSDHKALFMFVFCLNILKNEDESLYGAKSLILNKVNFLFNGLQIYQGDLLAMNYENKDFYRNPDWDLTKHKLQDLYKTIEGKVLPLVSHLDVKRASDIIQEINLSLIINDLEANDNLTLIKDTEELLSSSPELKSINQRKIEQSTQKIVKRIGGHVYRALQIDGLINENKRQQIYKEDGESQQLASGSGGRNSIKLHDMMSHSQVSHLEVKGSNASRAGNRRQSKSIQMGDQKDFITLGDLDDPAQKSTLVVPVSFQRKASIIRKSAVMNESPTQVAKGLRRRSITTTESRIEKGVSVKTLLPPSHFEAVTSLIQTFFETFQTLESDILQEKQKWLEMFFSTPFKQNFDPFELIPKREAKDKDGTLVPDDNPINKLLIIFVTKSESISKAIDGMVKHSLDPVFQYIPRHLLEIHATLEWFKRPTLVFYSFKSPNPVQRIVNASKKAFRQVIRISCGKFNFEVIKKKILDAAKGGYWLIIENLQMLPEEQILKILKFIFDRIVYVRQSFPNLRIWITFYVSESNQDHFMPLVVKKSLQTKLFQLTNECFKLYLTNQSGLKDRISNYYEQDIGYVLHEFEQHFYSVLLPKDDMHDKEKLFEIESNQFNDLIRRGVQKRKRKDLVKQYDGDLKPKAKFLETSDGLIKSEFSLNYKIYTMIAILLENLNFQQDHNKEFMIENQIVVQDEYIRNFKHFSWFFIQFLNKDMNFSKQFLLKSVVNYFGIQTQLTFGNTMMNKMLQFLINEIGSWSVYNDRKAFYYMFGEEETKIKTFDIKRFIKAMPDQDSLSILGISQNQGLIRWYNESKEVLQGLSAHFSNLKLILNSENKVKALFGLERDQMTLANRDLLLVGFNKQLEEFNDKIVRHRHKMQQKEDYCFGDIDKIIDLYLDQFDMKNHEDLFSFERKLRSLINQAPTAQKYVLYKENQIRLNTQRKNKIELDSNKQLLSVGLGGISDNQSLAGTASKKGDVGTPSSSQNIKHSKLKQKQQQDLSSLKKLYFDTVQVKEDEFERAIAILNFVIDLIPEPLTIPELKINLTSQYQCLEEEQSANEEEAELLKEKNKNAFVRTGGTNQVSNQLEPERRKSSRNELSLFAKKTGDPPKVGDQHLSPRPVPTKTVDFRDDEEQKLESPASPNNFRLRKFTMVGTMDRMLPQQNKSKQHITQALSDLDYSYKYKYFSHKNETVLRNYFTLEVTLMNKLLKKIKRQVFALKEFILGQRYRVLSLKDLNLYQSVMNNEVPGSWLKVGFFSKINVTLVEWFELLTAKYSFLQRWVIETKGSPPQVLKAAILFNPLNLFHQMLADYSNYYMVPFNCLGLVVYFAANKPPSQQSGSGIYFEGITLKNGHLNTDTGELEKALVREFEYIMPLMKIRVQTIRNCSLDSAESIPIVIRARQSKPLQRHKELIAQQTQFQLQNQNFAESLLQQLSTISVDQKIPLEPASPLKIHVQKSVDKPRIKQLITDVAAKSKEVVKQEDQVLLTVSKTQLQPMTSLTPSLRSDQRGGLYQITTASIRNEPLRVPQSNLRNPNLRPQNLTINSINRNLSLNPNSIKNVRGQLTVTKINPPTEKKSLIQLHQIESESSFESDITPGDRSKILKDQPTIIGPNQDFDSVTQSSAKEDKNDFSFKFIQELVSQNIKSHLITVSSNSKDSLPSLPINMQIFEPIQDDEEQTRYEVICPLVGSIESSSLFRLRFHFRFKSKYPQSYWDSVGLIAHFNSITKI